MKPGHAEIVGAGFGGLVAAIGLAERGWTCRVHERRESLRGEGYGIAIHNNMARIFASFGILDRVLAGGMRIDRRDSVDRDGRVVMTRKTERSPYRIDRQHIVALLAERARAAGIDIRFNSVVTHADLAGADRAAAGRGSRPGCGEPLAMRALLDKAVALRLNALVLQVRPSCDALYASKLEPWTEYLTGTMGRAPAPYYDPLSLAVAEAHRRGLELHAWFNPYRAGLAAGKSPVAANHIRRTRPQLVREYGKYFWLDPGERELDEGRRRGFFAEIQKLYADDLPALPMYFRVDPFVLPKPLKGVVPTGHLNSTTLWVEQWKWEN